MFRFIVILLLLLAAPISASTFFATPVNAQLSVTGVGGGFGPASGGGGTVTFDNKTSTTQDQMGGTSITTFSYTMGSASGGALLVPLIFGTLSVPTGLTVTYNGVSLTAITGTNTGINAVCTCSGVIYGMIGPATGANNIAISWTGAAEAHATVVSFTGVNQGSLALAFPNGTFVAQNTATAGPATGPVTSGTGHQVVGMATEESSAWGTISGTTIATSASGPQNTYASNYTTGAATVNPSFAFGSSSVWQFIATDVSP